LVRKLPSGRHQARYSGPDGLLRSAPETFPTQTDADRWLVRKEVEILDGRWKNPDDRILFGVYADAWFKERDYAATTAEERTRPRFPVLYRRPGPSSCLLLVGADGFEPPTSPS